MSPTPAVAEPVRWLGETIGFWIQTAILTVSAVGAVWIVAARGSQEKRRATVDLIIEQKRDEALQNARLVLRKMHEAGEKNLAKHLEKPDSEEYKSILLVLNGYEFVSCGIRSGALPRKDLQAFALLRAKERLGRLVRIHSRIPSDAR
jgi:preprotein translocase subunit Sss1